MTCKIILGSIVQLKSGSANMTVNQVVSDTDVLCVWHDAQQKEHRGVYSLTSLILIK